MTCKELIDFLMDYLDGVLPESKRMTFEQHLSICPSCVAYLDTYRESIRLGRLAYLHPEEPVPGDVPDELVRAILSARRS